jgi:2-methylcitrate dehydratase PrpD
MEITREYARFATGLRYEALSAEVVEAARRAILDTLAAALAGSIEPATRIVLETAKLLGGACQASVIGSDERLSVTQAALVNGVAAHALDYDDVNYSLRGHPSAPVLPAVLALAEHTDASGAEALTAFVAGFEIECKLGRSQGASHYGRGWHATSTHGVIGAAAASAMLLGLSTEQTVMALGVAGSLAAGSRQNFGTMTKPLHPGRAAEAGVMAALLAQRGFTADAQMLEAPLGFVRLFSPAGDEQPQRALENLGQPFDIVSPGVAVKKYPCCYNTHRALDATLALRAEHSLTAEIVERIEVRLPVSAAQPLIHTRPSTGLEGKFSMQYCLAAAIADGAPRLAAFDDAAVQRPALQSFLRRVEMITLPPEDNITAGHAEVSVFLSDGRVLQRRVDEPRGSGSDPLSWAELVEKFRDCAATVLPDEAGAHALGLIGGFEALPDLRGLLSTLSNRARVTA